MPSGETHRAASSIILPIGSVVSLAMAWHFPEASIGLTTGLFAGIWITPDLDTHNPLPGFLGNALGFESYRKNVKHRAGMKRRDWRMKSLDMIFMSHLPWIGTIYRTYLLIRWPLLFLLITGLIQGVGIFATVGFIALMWVGMSIQDTAHVVMDKAMKEKRYGKHHPNTTQQRR